MKGHGGEGVKKKAIALEATQESEETSSGEEEEDIALLSRKFRKFLKDKKN